MGCLGTTTICERIVLLRHRLGMSQKLFGEKIGRSTEYINRVENEKCIPSSNLLERISISFGVDIMWLKDGTGQLEVESIGDRFKTARKNRDYTQEELAEILHISRNSVGMIERGIFRPGEKTIDCLCRELWIDKNWLLTGQGSIERIKLTPFYELLKRDPELRKHIRSFIDHLDEHYGTSIHQPLHCTARKGSAKTKPKH